MPSQIAQPSITQADGPSQAAKLKARYILGDKPVIYGQSFSGSAAILPFETNLVGIQSQIMAMRGAYADQQQSLLTQVDIASNLQFGGILLAAAGVAADKIRPRNIGAGAAGLSGLWTSHYQLSTQAANYGVAAQAMSCLYKEIASVPQSFWTSAYDADGLFQVASANMSMTGATPEEVAAAYAALSGMFATLHDAVEGVDQKLRSLQAGVTIAKVSIADVQEAAAYQNTAEKTGKAIDSDKTAAGAAKAAAAAAGTAGGARAAADAAEAKAGADEQAAQALAARFNAAETKKRNAEQLQASLPGEIEKLQDKMRRPGDKSRTQGELDEMNAQLEKLPIEIKAAEQEMSQLSILRAKAEATAGTSAAMAAQMRMSANRAEKLARQMETWADLVSSGIAGRAAQLPAKAKSCLAAMGK